MTHSDKPLYEFGAFRLDVGGRLLLRGDDPVPLNPRLFELLLVFVEDSGRVLSKAELMDKLWPETSVEEANLTVNISALRKALGEGVSGQRYIKTVPGRGYQFVAEVQRIGQESEWILEEQRSAEIIIEEEQTGGAEDDYRLTGQPAAPLIAARPAGPAPRRALVRNPLAITLLLAMAVTGIAYLWFSMRAKNRPASPRSVAILPFKLVGTGEGDDYLGVGMADALITRLGSIKSFNVRPTSAVLKYARAEPSPVDVGRGLHVESVLEGTIRKSGDTYRVTVQLVSVETGAPIWTDKFDEKVTDILTVEDRLSAKMASALTLNLSGEEKARLARRHTQNAEAYTAYLQGRFHYTRLTPEGIRKAVTYFNQAVTLDPDFALAHAALASAYALLGFRTFGTLPPRETMPRAKLAAMRALELDEMSAEAHTALGVIKLRYEWDWPAAERELQRAIELKPAYAAAHQAYADCLLAMARYDEALVELKLAEESDPSSYVSISSTRLAHLYHNRQYDQLIKLCKELIDLDANSYLGHLVLGLAYEQKGMYEEAIAAARRAIGAVAGKSGEAALGHIYATIGRRGDALKLIEEFKAASRQTYVDSLHIAVIYAGLGDAEQALAWLEKGYQERSSAMIYLNTDPRYDWLHSHPKFKDLLKRIGFAGLTGSAAAGGKGTGSFHLPAGTLATLAISVVHMW